MLNINVTDFGYNISLVIAAGSLCYCLSKITVEDLKEACVAITNPGNFNYNKKNFHIFLSTMALFLSTIMAGTGFVLRNDFPYTAPVVAITGLLFTVPSGHAFMRSIESTPNDENEIIKR